MFCMLKVNRNYTKLKKMTKADDNYVKATPAEQIGIIWELTAELWSLKEPGSAERRIQKHIAHLISPHYS